jgi:hypothetical protein
MSYLSENVIPGEHGKIFGTNAYKNEDLEHIKESLLEIDGIKDVVFKESFPNEFTVLTSKMVEIKTVEKKVSMLGFHAVPKGLFQL